MKEKNKIVDIEYTADEMDTLITKKEAAGFLNLACARNVHYEITHRIFEDFLEVIRRYSKSDAVYQYDISCARKELKKRETNEQRKSGWC